MWIIYCLLFIVLVAGFVLGRVVYRRSMRIRSRLQMDRVFTNISHDLLTPLTVISASVERLRSQEPRFATDYALMELNIERMTRLLQEILETSKSQSGELKLLVSQGDVMEYLRQTALCIEPLMRKKGLDFSVHCTPLSMMGWIDPDKVDKIIYNLLSNASKYTHAPGSVVLDAMTNKNYDHVIIRVTDTGIGISKDQMRHLFHRFHDGSYRQMQVSGTGLGLALTRDLVFLHGGTIDCESEEGKGTTFTVTLPISKDHFNPSQIDNSHGLDLSTPRSAIIDIPQIVGNVSSNGEKGGAVDGNVSWPIGASSMIQTEPDEDAYRILLVEDNEDLLMLMKTLLSSKYHILTAKNGHEALEIVSREELDLIVADIMMPELDGNEMTRELKESNEWNHLPIILVTAKTSDEDRKKSMLLGADDYVTKPFKLGDLELRINNLVENRRRILRERMSELEQRGEKGSNGESGEGWGGKTVELTADEIFLSKARECVISHLSDSEFDRDTFASEMGASGSTLYNRIRALTGMGVTTFIRSIRMSEAERLLKTQPDLRVSDLAYKVGFKDPKYFSTCFKKEFGVQPSELLKN